MTVTSEYFPIKYIADGGEQNFPFSFRALESKNILVGIIQADETVKALLFEHDYQVSLNSSGFGGQVRANLAKDTKLVIWQETVIKQDMTLNNYGALDAFSLEIGFDRLTLIAQEHSEILKRVLKLPVASNKNPELVFFEIFAAKDQAILSAKEAKNSELEAKAVLVQVINAGEKQLQEMKLEAEKYLDLAKNEADRAENAASSIEGFAKNAQTFFGFYLDENLHLRAKKAESGESLDIKAYETWGILPSQIRFFINNKGHLIMQMPFV